MVEIFIISSIDFRTKPIVQLDEDEVVPRFSLSYVDMDLIRTRVKEWSSQMKEFFNNHNKGYILLDYDGKGRNVRKFAVTQF